MDKKKAKNRTGDKQAQNLLDAIEFAEDLSQLTLQQLFGLQQMVGNAIQEKITELNL